MKIIISPAKKLNFDTPLDKKVEQWSNSLEKTLFFADEQKTLQKIMQQQNALTLKKWMKISDQIAQLNFQRYRDWDAAPEKAAIFSFFGDVYRGIDITSLPFASLPQMQKKLRILSGLYGLLRPMDKIKPHRLEMGTPVKNTLGNNLYAFWGEKIAEQLKKELKKEECLIHLASKEYFQSVEKGLKKSSIRIITPIFLDRKKDGSLTTIGIYAKRARGLMARYIIEENCQNIKDIQQFNAEGYVFFAQKTQNDECQLIFHRG